MDLIYTIGHSNHGIEAFLKLLSSHGIQQVVDVRSHPYSRFNPHFRYNALAESLKAADIGYVFSGKALGARPDDPSCYEGGRVQFDRLARRPIFREALHQLREAAATTRVCLLCAEREPADCHRTLLVCRHLRDQRLRILHIIADGSLEDHRDLERRLLRLHGLEQKQLFSDDENHIEKAYELQAARILKPRR